MTEMSDADRREVLTEAKAKAVEMEMESVRQQLRLIGPQPGTGMAQKYPRFLHQDDYFVIKYCTVCNPPPKVYKCPICDAETTLKWQMQVHNMGGGNELCRRRGAKKEKVWASKVALDG